MPCAWPVTAGPRRRRHPRHQRLHQLVHRRGIQRVQGQRDPVAPGAEPGPGLAQLGAGEHQHVDGQVPGPVDQMVQELQQPGVGVLGVLDQQHCRSLRSEALEEQPPPGEQLLPRQRPPVILRRSDAEQPAQPRPDIGPLAGSGTYRSSPSAQLARGDVGRVFLGDAQPLADDLGQRPERHPLAVGQAPAPVPPHLLRQTIDVLLGTPSPAATCPPRPGPTPAPAAAPAARPRRGTAPGSCAAPRPGRSAAPPAHPPAATRPPPPAPRSPATDAAARPCPSARAPRRRRTRSRCRPAAASPHPPAPSPARPPPAPGRRCSPHPRPPSPHRPRPA